MTEEELERVVARASKYGVTPEDYVVQEIRSSLGRPPLVSVLVWEVKFVRALTGRRRGR
jgi:hypothetical protein